jgi:hypothetical protein
LHLRATVFEVTVSFWLSYGQCPQIEGILALDRTIGEEMTTDPTISFATSVVDLIDRWRPIAKDVSRHQDVTVAGNPVAWWFKDPDGHLLEMTTYHPQQGLPALANPNQNLHGP